MIALVIAFALAQATPCAAGAESLEAASRRAAVFDVAGAIASLTPVASCVDAEVSLLYLRGLVAAREAYRAGGSPDSLEPVRTAAAELGRRAEVTVRAEIARVVLLAASAAAQSEREEMGLLLEHAQSLEARQLSIGAPGAPMITAHEVAGDLWLQVHRFEDARLAYQRAAREIGATRRVTIGLARAAFRVEDLQTACREYRTLVAGWPASAGESVELAEARAFLQQPPCRSQTGQRSRQ